MRSLEEPDAPRGRRLLWILLGVAMLGGLVAWYATTRSAPPDTPATTPAGAARTDVPSSGNERATTTERPAPGAGHARGAACGPPRRADRPPARPAPATPAPPAREFRVTTDVPGAYVFLDRKFLGTTPFVSRDVAPGRYQLNVQVEGRPPVVRTVEVLADSTHRPWTSRCLRPPGRPRPGRRSTRRWRSCTSTAWARVKARCGPPGTGCATRRAHKDAFSLPYASVETFTRRLRREAAPPEAARRAHVELHDDGRQRRPALRLPSRRRGRAQVAPRVGGARLQAAGCVTSGSR